MRFLAATLSLAALACALPASAQQFDEEQTATLVQVALPSALSALQRGCEPALSRDAYIYAQGDRLMVRMRLASDAAWPAARETIGELAANGNLEMARALSAMPRDALQPFVDELVAGMVLSELDSAMCPRIDEVLELLDPLPPENLAALTGIVVIEAQKAKKAAAAQ